MSCNSCGTTSAITDVSNPLISYYQGSKFAPALTTLLRALDQVEMRMRTEEMPVSWKPSQFPQRSVPYGQRPEGTEVVIKNTPLYFENNDEYSEDLRVPGPDGGICDGESLCGEPPAHQVPGDTYQRFNWRMKYTAWETPQFCLKDLLFYENGVERLENFIRHVEKTPAQYYDNYIRNLIWETGEKYILADTDVSMLWNSPQRVDKRIAPNLQDFKTFAPVGATADAAVPTLAGLSYLQHILEQHMDDDFSAFNVNGQSSLMMVGVKPDIFSMIYNDDSACTSLPCSLVEGGAGFSPFSFNIVDQVPFATKFEKLWFRGDFDAQGEFQLIPMKVYVPQNGGQQLVMNPAWMNAPYGVVTFMTARPFVYRTFETLPNMPNIPEESKRYLRPRFQFAPKLEVCNYTRGLVQWHAEDEFGFQPTGEKIMHVIYRRDEQSAFMRQARAGETIEEITTQRTPIPQECPDPVPVSCCRTAGPLDIGGTDYSNTSYTIEYGNVDILDALGLTQAGLPAAAVFKTIKGSFNGQIFNSNAAGTIVSFGVEPAEHDGGHFCCTDQLIGFQIGAAPDPECLVYIDAMAPDPFDPTIHIAAIADELDAAATDTVTVIFDSGCGQPATYEATLTAIDNNLHRATLTFTPADFPEGVPCDEAVSICANNTAGCDCLPAPEGPCTPDAGVTPPPEELVAESSEGEEEVAPQEQVVESSSAAEGE